MFQQTFKHIDDILLKEAGCANTQAPWIPLLKYRDDPEGGAHEQRPQLSGSIGDRERAREKLACHES